MINIDKNPKNEIVEKAKELLKQGRTRQETFELLVDKYKYTNKVLEVMKQMPSSKAIEKYGKWNNVLLGIMLLIVAMFSVSIGPGSLLILYGFLIYAVITKRFEHYFWISILSFVILIAVLTISIININKSIDVLAIVLILALHLPMIYLPYWIEKKMCPKPKEHREWYTNHEGRDKIKIVYEFSDL